MTIQPRLRSPPRRSHSASLKRADMSHVLGCEAAETEGAVAELTERRPKVGAESSSLASHVEEAAVLDCGPDWACGVAQRPELGGATEFAAGTNVESIAVGASLDGGHEVNASPLLSVSITVASVARVDRRQRRRTRQIARATTNRAIITEPTMTLIVRLRSEACEDRAAAAVGVEDVGVALEGRDSAT